MKTVFVALLGLILGFFFDETLAVIGGMIGFAVFSSPSGPVLWILRILPVVSAIACAVVAVAVAFRRRPGQRGSHSERR